MGTKYTPVPPGHKLIFRFTRTCPKTGKLIRSTRSMPIIVPANDNDRKKRK
ncbi:hypothetical protein GCM10007148_02370 [Parvularcula lutaonensis]|nr:hypothetical protein GCM10007148_02370 [Parvularcula lutaonensis]